MKRAGSCFLCQFLKQFNANSTEIKPNCCFLFRRRYLPIDPMRATGRAAGTASARRRAPPASRRVAPTTSRPTPMAHQTQPSSPLPQVSTTYHPSTNLTTTPTLQLTN